MATSTLDSYEVGRRVMVPLHGLCEIVAQGRQEILGDIHLFYEMKPLGNEEEGIVKVPAGQMSSLGIRPTLSPEKMEEILEQEIELGEPPEGRPHQRLKGWVKMLRTGDAGCRRRVLQMLIQLEKSGDRLSKKEQELKQQIRLAFRQEVETVLELSPPQAGRRVNQAIS